MTTVEIHNRVHDYDATVRMNIWTCPSCGIVYGVPEDFADACRYNGTRYYCPNGHSLGWSETEADRERKKRREAERRASAAEDTAQRWRNRAEAERRTAEAERRSAAAYKGHLTRARNRIANGVCPVPGCKRSGFTQVARHIATAHPDWAHEHPEVLTA